MKSLRQVWAAAQRSPNMRKEVSEQDAEHHTIETGLIRQAGIETFILTAAFGPLFFYRAEITM